MRIRRTACDAAGAAGRSLVALGDAPKFAIHTRYNRWSLVPHTVCPPGRAHGRVQRSRGAQPAHAGVTVPTISMFYGILVLMYFRDNRRHHLPHIHVRY